MKVFSIHFHRAEDLNTNQVLFRRKLLRWADVETTHNALLYANYRGSENRPARCGETYALMTGMAPVLLEKKGTGEMLGFAREAEKAGQTWRETFQEFAITFTAGPRLRISAGSPLKAPVGRPGTPATPSRPCQPRIGA